MLYHTNPDSYSPFIELALHSFRVSVDLHPEENGRLELLKVRPPAQSTALALSRKGE